MAELINELIAPEVFTQLKEAEEGLDNLAKSVANLGKMGKVIEFNVKGATSLNEYTAAIEEMKKATAAMGAMSEQYSKQVQSVTSAERDQAAARRDNARAMLDEEKAAKLRNSEIEREEKALKNLTNEYETLKRSYTTAANAAKELGIALGTDSKEFKAAASAAKGMYDQLLKVERAVGQGQRAVGQYNQAAFAMQQILREGPAFANSFATGIMAISNNIPILIDEIKRMQIANEELKTSGATTIPIWKTLLGSIFSPMGLMSLALTGFTFLAAKVDLFSEKADKAKESADAFAESLKNVGRAASENEKSQTQSASALAKIAGDEKERDAVRIAAFKELQKMYPQYLENLKAEDMLKGRAFEELQKIKEEIKYRTELQAIEETGVVLRKRASELQGEIDKASTLEDQYKLKQALVAVNKELELNAKDYEDYKKAVLTFPTAEEKSPKSKKPKADRKPKDMELKSESELLKAEYELSKQRVEQDAQIQKEIADNEKNTINQRLDAYMEYTADVLQLLRMAKDYEIKQEDLKIQDIKRKKKDAKAVELIALQDQEDAANVRKKGIEEKFQNDLSDVERKGNKDRLAILNTGNEQWIKSEEFRNAKLKEQQVTWFLTQEALLKKALDAKEITTKEYNTRLRNLQKQEGQMLLDDDIELYTRLLENKTLSAEKQLEIQNKLNAALKQKSQGGAEPTQRRSGRLTDSLGKSLGIVEEDALQEFYDRTVQLANQAADAIIAAKERQFQAEQDMLDKQKEGIQANYEMQLDYINATTRNETERANKIAQLQAQKAAQEATIEQKKREVAKRQATFEKTAAIASIIQNTAVAIAGALKYGVAAPPIIALIAAAGAVQLAAAANAPIPAYKEGTNYHQGGMFIAGDGGQKELIIAPNKKPYFSASTSTLYNEAAGTKVIPGDIVKQMENNITSTASYGGSSMPSIEYDRLATLISDKIGSHLWQHGENISHTIMAARPKMPKQDMREAVLQLQRLGK